MLSRGATRPLTPLPAADVLNSTWPGGDGARRRAPTAIRAPTGGSVTGHRSASSGGRGSALEHAPTSLDAVDRDVGVRDTLDADRLDPHEHAVGGRGGIGASS